MCVWVLDHLYESKMERGFITGRRKEVSTLDYETHTHGSETRTAETFNMATSSSWPKELGNGAFAKQVG